MNGLQIALAADASETYSLSGGSLMPRAKNSSAAKLPWQRQLYAVGGLNSVPSGLVVDSSTSATYSLSGGSLYADDEHVGAATTGIFTQSGGANSMLK